MVGGADKGTAVVKLCVDVFTQPGFFARNILVFHLSFTLSPWPQLPSFTTVFVCRQFVMNMLQNIPGRVYLPQQTEILCVFTAIPSCVC